MAIPPPETVTRFYYPATRTDALERVDRDW
jgi:hypothetical protein